VGVKGVIEFFEIVTGFSTMQVGQAAASRIPDFQETLSSGLRPECS
jgi:hypothetical protein